MYRVHPPDPVHGWQWDATHHAVRGDPRLAPSRWQVAEHTLPSLWIPQLAHQVRFIEHLYCLMYAIIIFMITKGSFSGKCVKRFLSFNLKRFLTFQEIKILNTYFYSMRMH